ncbi:MAG: hypothetical protein OES24_23890 [Acidimicrobiia bacterium]|nr:hypothetical protein [Acidimicrobiia bacterium]
MITENGKPSEQTQRSEQNARRRSNRVPGFGWRPDLTGLERPGQWLGIFLGTLIVLAVAALITYLSSLY